MCRVPKLTSCDFIDPVWTFQSDGWLLDKSLTVYGLALRIQKAFHLASAEVKLIMHNKKSIARNIVLTSAWTKSHDITAVYTTITAVAFFHFWISKEIEYVRQNIHFLPVWMLKLRKKQSRSTFSTWQHISIQERQNQNIYKLDVCKLTDG